MRGHDRSPLSRKNLNVGVEGNLRLALDVRIVRGEHFFIHFGLQEKVDCRAAACHSLLRNE